MPASRNRTLVPLLLLLVVAAVVTGLLLTGSDQPDEGTPREPTATPAATTGADEATTAGEPDGASAVPDAAPDLTRRVADDPMAVGPIDAPVGVVVYSDFSCPYCQRWAQETQPVLLEYAQEGALRLEWRDVSILGEESTRAAVAAAAAAEQDAFWEYQELLFADLDARSPEQLTAMAEQVGLDVARFAADLTDPAVLGAVQRDVEEAQALGVQSTPSFLVGGTPVVGAQPTEVFVQIVEQELARTD